MRIAHKGATVTGPSNPVRRLGVAAAIGLAIGTILYIAGIPARPESGAPRVPPFAVSATSVTQSDGQLVIAADLVSRFPRRVRIWYVLAEPGDPEPWKRFAFQSVAQEVDVPGNSVLYLDEASTTTVLWSDVPGAADGTYQPSIWIHEWINGAWRHLEGGVFEMPLVTITGHGPATTGRFGGPATITVDGLSQSSGIFAFRVAVSNVPEAAVVTWYLVAAGASADAPVYSSRPLPLAGVTTPIQFGSEMYVPASGYDLVIRVGMPGEPQALQEAVFPAAFHQEAEPPFVRRSEPLGNGVWTSTGEIVTFSRGDVVPLPLRLSSNGGASECTTRWEWRLSGGGAIRGQSDGCESPAVTVPGVAETGAILSVEAWTSAGGASSTLSDVVELTITFTE